MTNTELGFHVIAPIDLAIAALVPFLAIARFGRWGYAGAVLFSWLFLYLDSQTVWALTNYAGALYGGALILVTGWILSGIYGLIVFALVRAVSTGFRKLRKTTVPVITDTSVVEPLKPFPWLRRRSIDVVVILLLLCYIATLTSLVYYCEDLDHRVHKVELSCMLSGKGIRLPGNNTSPKSFWQTFAIPTTSIPSLTVGKKAPLLLTIEVTNSGSEVLRNIRVVTELVDNHKQRLRFFALRHNALQPGEQWTTDIPIDDPVIFHLARQGAVAYGQHFAFAD